MKRIIAILLSLVVLFSTTGFTLVTHFCGGVALESKIMLFGDAPCCGMEVTDSGCDAEGMNFAKRSCCDNESFQIKVEDAFERIVKGENTPSFQILTLWVMVAFNLPQSSPSNIYADYTPPPLLKNLIVTNQVFRL